MNAITERAIDRALERWAREDAYQVPGMAAVVHGRNCSCPRGRMGGRELFAWALAASFAVSNVAGMVMWAVSS